MGGSITAGNIFSAGNLEVTGNTSLWSGLAVNGSLSLYASTSSTQTTSIFNISNATGTTPIFTVLYNGNVGIGTSSPYTALSILGTTTATAFFATSTTGVSVFAGAVQLPGIGDSAGTNPVCWNSAAGTISYSTSCTASSERFKENISTSTYGLAEVLKLDPKFYTYKKSFNSNDDGSRRLGFIAEQTDLIIPELTGRNDKGEIDSFNYANLTAVLTKAIQELSASTTEMYTKLDALISDEKVNTAFWTVEEGTGSIKLATARALDLGGEDILNVRKILSFSGGWSITEDGVINVDEFCLEEICLNRPQLEALLQYADVEIPTTTPITVE